MKWEDINLAQFMELRELDLNDLEGQIRATEIILKIDADDLTFNEFAKKTNELDFLSKPIPETIIRMEYKLNGKKYVCKPNLNELSVTRYMDFTTLAPTGQLEKILAVVLIPDGCKYGEYDVEEVYKDILTMNIVDAYAVFNFFQMQFKACIKTLKDYSVKALRKDKKLAEVVSVAMDCCSTLDL